MAARKRPAAVEEHGQASDSLQVAHDAELASRLQEELDLELAHELSEQLHSQDVVERRARSMQVRLERKAGKEITHLGKSTLTRIGSALGVATTLRGVLTASKDDATFVQLLELVDPGQREQVRLEIESLLLDEDLAAML